MTISRREGGVGHFFSTPPGYMGSKEPMESVAYRTRTVLAVAASHFLQGQSQQTATARCGDGDSQTRGEVALSVQRPTPGHRLLIASRYGKISGPTPLPIQICPARRLQNPWDGVGLRLGRLQRAFDVLVSVYRLNRPSPAGTHGF